MKIAVLDDEKIYHKAINNIILEWKRTVGLHSLAIDNYLSSEDMLHAWEQSVSYDLVFLDIEIVDDINGIQLAQKLRQLDEWVQIVFITNYAKYASIGYGLNALRYLQKPIVPDQIFDCLNIAFSKYKLRAGESLVVTGKNATIALPHHMILYIESIGHNITIHKTDQSTITISRRTIAQMLELLDSSLFCLCYRSIIVNISYVRRFTPSEVTLADDTILPLGKTSRAKFIYTFNQYYQGGSL